MTKLKKIPRICGSCLFFSMWTGDCCKDFEWRNVGFDDKACKHWEQSEDYSFETKNEDEDE